MRRANAKVDETCKPLPRAVVLLGWVSFFADVSSEMVYPLIPMYVVLVLGASATTLGTIEGAAALVVAIVTAWTGFRSDRTRLRLPYIRLGYGLPVIGKTLMAVAFAWPMVLGGRLIDRMGKGLRTSPRDALIADAAGPTIRGRAFGFHRAMDTTGAIVGVLIAALGIFYMANGVVMLLASVLAGVLWDRFGPSATFAVGAVFAVLALVLVPLLRPRTSLVSAARI